ncbi:oxidoreductase [Kordiimonas sp.]|uniref:oxidoreductase n=1 Tax=Kordiimonas sp. TaxID=1970157 RepID=UPI003A91FDFE
MSAIKTAIIGYGLSAKVFQIPFIMANGAFDLVAISSSRSAEINKNLPDVTVYADAEEMIARSDAELILITAPNETHYNFARYALERDKHVLVEKPFVTTSADGLALIELARERGLVLSVYHNRRWDGDFLTVKKLIQNGTLGKVRYFESHFDRFRPAVKDTWRESDDLGSGILFDLGPHLIDQAVMLFGVPEAVTAQVIAARSGAVTDDMFRLTFHYKDILAVLVSSPFCSGPNLRFKVEGEAASYIKYGLDPQEARLRSGQTPVEERWAAEDAAAFGMLYAPSDMTSAEGMPVDTEIGGYQHFFAALASSLRRKGKVPVTASQAVMVIKIIEAAQKSASSGQTVSLSPLMVER